MLVKIKLTAQCAYCSMPATVACDHKDQEGKECLLPMCNKHRSQGEVAFSKPAKDLCRKHRKVTVLAVKPMTV